MNFKANESAVVHSFQSFYYELLRQKEIALSTYFSDNTSKDPDVENKSIDEQHEIEVAIFAIQKKIISAIEIAIENINQKSKLQVYMINEVKYIITVYADEIFIHLKWDGAKYWRFSLLEKQLFESEIAGENFFIMLDAMMANANGANHELVFLYFMTLSLGFQGKYRNIKNVHDDIEMYKERLYNVFHDKPSRLFYPGKPFLISSCYDAIYKENNNINLPDVKFWSWCLVSIIFVYIIVSYMTWYSITDELSGVLHQISEQIKSGPLI